MKKIIGKTVSVLIFSMLFPIVSFATIDSTGNWEYSDTSRGVTLTDYVATKSEAHIVIPEEVDGLHVSGLSGTFEYNKKIKSVIIPENIEWMVSPFLGCTSLKEVNFEGEGLELIGIMSFENCDSLEELEIPDSVTEIGLSAFSGCDELEEIVLPENLKRIGYSSSGSDDYQSLVFSGKNMKRVINNSSIEIPSSIFVDRFGFEKYHYWYFDEDGYYQIVYDGVGLQPGETAYQLKQEPLLEQYYDKYIKNLRGNTSDTPGSIKVDMTVANTPETVEKYVEAFLPTIEQDYISMSIEVLVDQDNPYENFLPAVAGTADNHFGESGYCYLLITMEDSFSGRIKTNKIHLYIKPTPYERHSSSGGSGSSSVGGGINTSIAMDNNIIITKPNLMSGKWQNSNGLWKLQQSDGSYASSQWAYIDNNWYLFNGNENMLTGWQKVNGEWYYLHTDGAARTSWQIIEGKWYYFDNNGKMLTGWQDINNKYYYFNTSGAMLYNTLTPDGYTVNAEGVWIE